MNTRPYFSIMLPAKGRPELVRDALQSILKQSEADFEILVSNNGADPAVKLQIEYLLSDTRIRYFEQTDVLNMPDHWEAVSRLADGHYFMVLTDRSVLAKDALKQIREYHESDPETGKIVTWGWDLYYDKHALKAETKYSGKEPQILPSRQLALDVLDNSNRYPYALPRGLNSSVSTLLLEEQRQVSGSAFSELYPDFSFAFRCLMQVEKIIYANRSMMISQGLSNSTGGNALIGDPRPYFETLNIKDPFRMAPSKALLIEAGIFEDFLRAADDFKQYELLKTWNRASYYIKCRDEINLKRNSGIVPSEQIDEWEKLVELALMNESETTRRNVNESGAARRSLKASTKQWLRKALTPYLEYIRPYLLKFRGAQKWRTALEAAGFDR